MNKEIVSQLERLLKQEVRDLGANFAEDEQAVMQMMMSLGKGLLQRVVDSGTNGYQGSSIPCECGGSMKFVQHRTKDIHTLFGWIKLKRAYYHCPECYRCWLCGLFGLMADGSNYGRQNPWQPEKSTYKREAHPPITLLPANALATQDTNRI